jgi:hypothetical protein
LPPNEELDGDTGAALAVWVSVGIAISEIKASAAMNFLKSKLLKAVRYYLSVSAR